MLPIMLLSTPTDNSETSGSFAYPFEQSFMQLQHVEVPSFLTFKIP